MRDPPFVMFPKLDTWFRFLFPKRQQLHHKVAQLLDLLQGVIENKRADLMKKGTMRTVRDNEKDLLTLLLEAGENDPKDALNNEELLVC